MVFHVEGKTMKMHNETITLNTQTCTLQIVELKYTKAVFDDITACMAIVLALVWFVEGADTQDQSGYWLLAWKTNEK